MTAQPGDSATLTHRVGPDDTAVSVGSGDLPVLGTPILLAWLEATTCAVLDVGADRTSVGIRMEVDHVLASGVGSTITTSATVESVDDRRIEFSVTARDQDDSTVGSGTITRAVVDRERFLERVPSVEQ